MDLHQQITDNNSKDRSALVYDFSTFSLKSSSTSEFKLWWETSLGCEHLISPGCAQPHTPNTRTHTQLISLGVSGRLDSLEHDIRIIHLAAVNLQTLSLSYTHIHTHLWLLWDRTLTFCSSLQERIIYYFWGSFIIGVCNAALCKCDAVLFLFSSKSWSSSLVLLR